MKTFSLLFLLFSAALMFAQPATSASSYDTLYKRAQMGIYENPDRSIAIINQLLEQEKNTEKKINLYLVLSSAYVSKRNFDTSLKYILKAKELLKDTNIPKIKINVLISIAAQYQQMELFSKSLETLDEAEQLIRNSSAADNSNFNLGKIFAIRGMIYKSQSNPELALQKFLASYHYFRETPQGKPSSANMSIVLYNIGYCYLDLNQNEEAEKNFLKSVEYSKKATANSLEAFSLKGLAEVYTISGRNKEALRLLGTAENLSKNVGDLVLNEGIYKGMADNYLILNQSDEYSTYHQKYLKTRFEREQSELKSINTSIDNTTTEAENQMKTLRSRFGAARLIILTIGLAAIAVLLLLIFRIRKKNRLLEEKIREITQ